MTVIQYIKLKGYATSQELERMFSDKIEELHKVISFHISHDDIIVDRFRMENGRENAYYILKK
jgi:predicted DNA-binding ribbon-helix-helix protein